MVSKAYSYILMLSCFSYVQRFAIAWTVACPNSSAHKISQAGILKWVSISFSKGSFQPRDRTQVSCIGNRILYHWVTRKAPCQLLPFWKNVWSFFGKIWLGYHVYFLHSWQRAHTRKKCSLLFFLVYTYIAFLFSSIIHGLFEWKTFIFYVF